MDQLIYSKEYSIGEMLGWAWEIYRKNLALILAVTLVIAVPGDIALALVSPQTWGDVPDAGKLMSFLLIFAVFSLVSLLPPIALAFMVKGAVDGKPEGFNSSYGKALKRWPHMIITTIIYLAIILVPYIVLMAIFLGLGIAASSTPLGIILLLVFLIITLVWLFYIIKYSIL